MGRPNGASDIATFAQSSQTTVGISTSVEVNSIVFTPASNSFTLKVPPDGASGGEVIISGTGVINNNSVRQSFIAANGGQIIFNNASTAGSAHMSIVNEGGDFEQFTRQAIQSSAIRRVRLALRLRTRPKTILEIALVGKQSSTAHRLLIMPPSATKSPRNHMPVAARQFSMTHQLRPTLPLITGQAVPPVVLPV